MEKKNEEKKRLKVKKKQKDISINIFLLIIPISISGFGLRGGLPRFPVTIFSKVWVDNGCFLRPGGNGGRPLFLWTTKKMSIKKLREERGKSKRQEMNDIGTNYCIP